MDYKLLTDIISLLERFESENRDYPSNIAGFQNWIYNDIHLQKDILQEPDWEGKNTGRSAESVIATLLIRMNRYAKTYSKSAMQKSDFSTQDDFIYLINLKASGPMTKMELIKMNIQDKPTGMQIINRLIAQGWVEQRDSQKDKRSKIVSITLLGINALETHMNKIRQATQIVSGNLNCREKMELIKLLTKLNNFHNPIFLRNIESAELLDYVSSEYL